MSDGGWGSGAWGQAAWGKSYFLPVIQEASSAADAAAPLLRIDRSVSEGATVAEVLLDARQGFAGLVLEQVAAVDGAPLAGSAYLLSVFEGTTALDRVVAQMRFEAAVVEASTALAPITARPLWEPTNDNQNANWQNVADAQNPGWAPVDESQTAAWRDAKP